MKAKDIIDMFNSSKMLARHGDVVLVKTDLDAEVEGNPSHVVAEGEVTGHAHRLATRDLSAAQVSKIKGQIDQMVLRVVGDTALTHEEHDDGDLTSGQYFTGIQKMYNPAGWRRVVD